MMKNLSFNKKILFSKTSLRQNVFFTVSRQIFAAVIQLIVVALVARVLGPEGNGNYAMVILIPSLLANLSNLGIAPATVYFTARKKYSIREIFLGNIKLVGVISLLSLTISGIILVEYSETIFPHITTDFLYLGVFVFPVMLILSCLSAILQGLERFKEFNISILTPPIINLVGAVLSLYIFSYGILGVVISFVVGQLVALGFVLYFLITLMKNNDVDLVKANNNATLYYKDILGYGCKSHVSNIVTFINYRIDIFLVNFFLTPVATGLYVIAVQISEKIWIPSQAISTVLFPRLSAMSDKPKERIKLTNRAFVIVATITAILGLATAYVIKWLIGPILGDEYKKVLPALFWLLPGVVFWAGARIQANCISAIGKPHWNMHVSLMTLSINVIGNIILIPRYGIIGAAWSTSIAYSIDAVVKYGLILRTKKIRHEL